MDTKTYAGFVAAAELLNITLAAQRLNITQSRCRDRSRALRSSRAKAV